MPGVEPMRVLFVISEHEGGITAERREGYELAQARIASLTTAAIESAPYWALESLSADALVLSGSADPWALHRRDALERFYELLGRFPGPVLGICAGMQMLAEARGGVVGRSAVPTRGFATIDVLDPGDLFSGSPSSFEVLQNHEDEIVELPADFRVLATSKSCRIEAIAAGRSRWWGTQFHPEAWDDEHPAGRGLIERYLDLAGCPPAERSLP